MEIGGYNVWQQNSCLGLVKQAPPELRPFSTVKDCMVNWVISYSMDYCVASFPSWRLLDWGVMSRVWVFDNWGKKTVIVALKP